MRSKESHMFCTIASGADPTDSQIAGPRPEQGLDGCALTGAIVKFLIVVRLMTEKRIHPLI